MMKQEGFLLVEWDFVDFILKIGYFFFSRCRCLEGVLLFQSQNLLSPSSFYGGPASLAVLLENWSISINYII